MSFEGLTRVNWLVEWFRHARDCGTDDQFDIVCETVEPPLTPLEKSEIAARTSALPKKA